MDAIDSTFNSTPNFITSDNQSFVLKFNCNCDFHNNCENQSYFFLFFFLGIESFNLC